MSHNHLQQFRQEARQPFLGRCSVVVFGGDDEDLQGLVMGPPDVPEDTVLQALDAAYLASVQAHPKEWNYSDMFDGLPPGYLVLRPTCWDPTGVVDGPAVGDAESIVLAAEECGVTVDQLRADFGIDSDRLNNGGMVELAELLLLSDDVDYIVWRIKDIRDAG
jgi:hypothetical protein